MLKDRAQCVPLMSSDDPTDSGQKRRRKYCKKVVPVAPVAVGFWIRKIGKEVERFVVGGINN